MKITITRMMPAYPAISIPCDGGVACVVVGAGVPRVVAVALGAVVGTVTRLPGRVPIRTVKSEVLAMLPPLPDTFTVYSSGVNVTASTSNVNRFVPPMPARTLFVPVIDPLNPPVWVCFDDDIISI